MPTGMVQEQLVRGVDLHTPAVQLWDNVALEQRRGYVGGGRILPGDKRLGG